MKRPHLGEAPYFRIPPRVTLKGLESKLDEVGLGGNKYVRRALNLASSVHENQVRYSNEPVLEEHIYTTTLAAIAYQEHEKSKGNPEFSVIHPEGPIVALLHDVPDDGSVSKLRIRIMFGNEITGLLWPLTDDFYGDALDYEMKISRKFETLRESRWPTQIGGLADRLTNSLSYYTAPYIAKQTGEPQPILRRQLRRDKEIVIPVAQAISPDFFYEMFVELMGHYKAKYPTIFDN